MRLTAKPQVDRKREKLLFFPDGKPMLLAAGIAVLGLAHYVTPRASFFSTTLSLTAFILIGWSTRSKHIHSHYKTAIKIITAGLILVYLETIRLLIPSIRLSDGIAVFLSLPVTAVLTVHIYRALTLAKTKIGNVTFFLFLFLVFVSRSPRFPIFTALLLLAAFPYRWPGELNSGERRYINILGLTCLSGFIALHAIKTETLMNTTRFNFLEAGVYSLGSTLIRVFVYSGFLYGLWRMFKPMRIRTRLRWAFLLNFFVPFTLLLILSVITVVFLVGGYNAAVAQRIIGQYGVEAAQRARNMFDAYSPYQAMSKEDFSFVSAACIRHPDGTDQSIGGISPEITKWLNHGRNRQVEYISFDRDGQWEFWVAGYYHRDDNSGAVVAFRVDQDMLNKVREVTGLELMLVKGQSFPWIDRKPVEAFYQSDGLENAANENAFFNVGAALFYEPSEDSPIKLSATLRVLGTRDMLLRALMMSQINQYDRDQPGYLRPVALQFGTVTSDSLDLENINIWNVFLFIFLTGMLGVLAALVILSLSTSFLISRRINRSVKALKDGTSALDSGNLQYRIPIISGDELGELARDFNQMAESLGKSAALREKLLLEQVEKEKLQETLETARLLQQSLLPDSDIVNHPALEIAADFRPMDTVGGDYYDYLWFRDNGIGLVIGDVSGHGMSAGLLMVMAKSCLVNQVRTSPGIQDVMSALNNMILDSFQSKRIMTFQYAVFTPDGDRMRFASAGHQFPYVYRKSEQKLEEIESICYPLGVRPSVSLDTREVILNPGDSVLFFTDGLVEAENPLGEQMGYSRLEEIFREIDGLSPQEVVAHVMYRIDQFRNGAQQLDDMTFVVVHRRFPGESGVEEHS
jgi:serine phosphatase RsbU (regulator of sigma subunit)